jgi:hypothetical protein
MSDKSLAVVPEQRVFDAIISLHEKRVILDADLARFYGVPTHRLNEAVSRNAERFPSDFCFTIDRKELVNLKSQFATSSLHGGKRKLPRAFTEHGAIMAATLLNSPVAVQMSILVVRAFVKMREELASTRELAVKLKELENKLTSRIDGHDQTILELIEQMREFMYPPIPAKEPIGFREAGEKYRVSKKRKAA